MSKPRPHTDTETKRAIVAEIRAGELTQAAAARRVGVSAQSIGRWMAGARRPARPSRFVGVDLTPSTATSTPALLAEIGLSRGRTLRVPIDVAAGDLARLVRVLESVC